ncbi:MAG TPA: ABC transporter substrate-binding protein, partial [Chloroflexia bacterium]|nr:ABC transporter substrate-binding protein [Chloroflexia bacterium]
MFKKMGKQIAVLIALTLVVAGCGSPTPVPQGGSNTPAAGTEAAASATGEGTNGAPTKVTIALGYVPDVQFAPFYVALQKGYYRAEGLDVTLRNGIVQDLVGELGMGANNVNVAAVSGDELIPARIAGVPVKYVMTWYRQYP